MLKKAYLGAIFCLAAGPLFGQSRPPSHVVPGRPVVGTVPAVAGANGEWRQWRGNPEHTGFQRIPGKIQTPSVRWRYPIGGRLQRDQAVLCSVPGREASLLVAQPGSLASYSLDGRLLWHRRNALSLTLLGCWDFSSDGRVTLLASLASQSGTALYFFDASDGHLLWGSPMSPGALGSVKVTSIRSGSGLNVLWLPAADSRLFVYGFPPGWTVPIQLYRSTIRDFVSDPYTPSALTVADLYGDGLAEIVISGGRRTVPTLVLDAASGNELSRSYVTIEGHGFESGGVGQLLLVTDLDPSGAPSPRDIVTVSSYNSGQTYMFQGITITRAGSSEPSRVLDTYPVGLHYARGSVRDFDGDGRAEILASRYETELREHELELLDTSSFEVKASVPNFYLLSVVDLPGSSQPLVIGWEDVATENPVGSSLLAAYRFNGSAFERTAWNPGVGTLASVIPRSYDEAPHENPGDSVVLIDEDPHLGPSLLAYSRNEGREQEGLSLLDASTGAVLSRYDPPDGVKVGLVAVSAAAKAADRRFVVTGTDGSLVFLDGSLHQISAVSLGGYDSQDYSTNGHSFEIAVAADLDGRGRNAVVLVDSRSRLIRLTGLETATPLQGPGGVVLWDSGIPQEMVAVPSPYGGSRLLVRGRQGAKPFLSLMDGSGRVAWQHVFAGPDHDPPEDGLPIGLNILRSAGSPVPDVVCSVGSGPDVFQTFALNGLTGDSLWRSGVGTFWDATLAVSDFDGDGRDDVIFNWNSQKGIILDGRTGDQRAMPVALPEFSNLDQVDYNGAPIVIGQRGADGLQFLNACDNAHLSLLPQPVRLRPATCRRRRPSGISNKTPRTTSAIRCPAWLPSALATGSPASAARAAC